MRPFTDVLRDIRRGRVVNHLTDELARVIQGVLDTDKPGALTLTLTIKPQGKGDNAVVMTAKTTAKVPQPALPDALFFADLDGGLHRDDPTQQRLFADATPAATPETYDPETGELKSA